MKALVGLKKVWKVMNEGWTGTLFYCFLGLIVALSVHWALGIVFHTDLPIVTVSSRSMVPTLNVGDIVFIKGSNEYKPGDIIVFKGWEPEPIIHRVVAYTDGKNVFRYDDWNEMSDDEILSWEAKIYITKGDNNPSCDQCAGKLPVRQQNIYGKMILVVPYLGWVKILFVRYFVRKPLVGIGTAIILGALYWVYKRW